METTTPRLTYIIDHYGNALSEALLKRERRKLTPIQAVLKFSEFDPSRNKSATQWLVKIYLAKGFRFEDLSKAKETLQLFGQNRNKLPISKRDLNSYSELSHVWQAIEGFVNTNQDTDKTGKELKRADKEKAYQEAFTLYEDDTGFKIVSPLTEFASCWWGQGTRWCTASDNNNMFEHYNEQAPLFIIMVPTLKNGQKTIEKFQLFVVENDFQFVNASDEDVSADKNKEITLLEPLLDYATSVNPRLFIYRNQQCSDKVYRDAITLDEHLIKAVPYERLTKEMFLATAKGTEFMGEITDLKLFKHPVLNKAFYKELIEFSSAYLSYVPGDYLDREMCERAVEKCEKGYMDIVLNAIPFHMKTKALVWKAFQQDPYVLENIEEKYWTPEILTDAVSRNSWVLFLLKDNFLTEGLCDILPALKDGASPKG